MPELPEVEVVRRGLHEHLLGRTFDDVTVLHPRAVRRHTAGHLPAMLRGRTVTDTRRRGKYAWLVLDESDALLIHLGMSGQLLISDAGHPIASHDRVVATFTDRGPGLRFRDQRTFGHLLVDPGGARIPRQIRHIAPDFFEDSYDGDIVLGRLRRRRSELKRALLDQSLVSGIGNIYADEALWRARLHGARPADRLRRADAAATLDAAREVMSEALADGGTSFDKLYVHVNGASGYFDRSLRAYGRAGLPCERCGTPIVREPFMNRSSFSCPRCQPAPRRRAGRGVPSRRRAVGSDAEVAEPVRQRRS